MSARLCATCNGIFTGPQILRQEQPHHKTLDGFRQAAARGCYICGIITRSPSWKTVETSETSPESIWYLTPHSIGPPGWLRLVIDAGGEESDWEDTGSDYDDKFLPLFPGWSFTIELVNDTNGGNKVNEVPTSLHDPAMLQVAKSWLEECNRGHLFCRPPNPSFNPTRLIHLADENSARLVLTRGQLTSHKYVAFSHCWGKAKTLKLLQANLQTLLNSIHIDDLPTSYKEAILITMALGYRYIWIDSLCIIQDSMEDWTKEAAMMQDVYENSSLNICASAAAENSEASFEFRDPAIISPPEVVSSWTGLEVQTYRVADAEMFEKEIEFSPLRQRAWVLQEVWLSRRSLSLTKTQFWWECKQKIACEAYPRGMPSELIHENIARDMHERNEMCRRTQSLSSDQIMSFEHSGATEQEIDRQWYDLVESYSNCGLTNPSDKLIAFSGITQHFCRKYSLVDDDYIAGIWRWQLPAALCWQTQKHGPTHRPDVYRAPSWSWASVEGSLHFTLHNENIEIEKVKHLCNVLDIQLHYANMRYKTGLLNGGCIHLCGQVIGPLTMELECSTGGEEIRDALSTVRWDLDEIMDSGDDAVTYLEKLDPNVSGNGFMNNTTRKQLHGVEENLRFFLLPILRFEEDGQDLIRGLVIYQDHDHPDNMFQRIGFLSSMEMSQKALDQVLRKNIILF
ncbi:HET-domain-containing protein [Hypoxylon sp. FL0890]|nr:HET-domain-containing protein [Hypoxylon sp. FL0890]